MSLSAVDWLRLDDYYHQQPAERRQLCEGIFAMSFFFVVKYAYSHVDDVAVVTSLDE